ncbi:MAG TPA: fructose 1,6-bisphosphatase [Steroidobacteraceae bacterium]|nr:fructose 1,6-bisphosphatase [Steroidobacteraceae bacterium]
MRLTLSVIKADVGAIGGHLAPSKSVVDTIRESVSAHKRDLIVDYAVGFIGDAVTILMTHARGAADSQVHRIAWQAFVDGARVAREQGLSGAGHDLLTENFPGRLESTGPDSAEMTIDERSHESFLLFAADKANPTVFNLPLYLAFGDPMNTPSLALSSALSQGFRFQVLDIDGERNRIIDLEAPERLYDLAAVLRVQNRYVITSVWTRATDDHVAQVSPSRLHNDDPVMLVRTYGDFPTTGEVLAPYATGHLVGSGIHGLQQMPLMPVPLATKSSFFDGPPLVSCAAFSVHDGLLTEPIDAFAHPFWDAARERIASKAMDIRKQGFLSASPAWMGESAYSSAQARLESLDRHFTSASP